MSLINDLRDFANGRINESTLANRMTPKADYDFESDDAFMQECMGDCLPTILQMELMDEAAVEAIDEDVKEAFLTVQNYLIENGMMDEAAAIPVGNPKITVVRMSREAQKKRLTSMIALKMARKANMKQYKKYKIGQKIRKENFSQIMDRFGQKAERLANKLIQQSRKGKVGAVVEKKKAERGSKSKK